MKKLMMLVCVGLVAGAVAEVEYGSLMGAGQSVTIEAGETFTVMANNFNTADPGYDIRVLFPPDSSTFVDVDFYVNSQIGTYNPYTRNATTPEYGVIAGPCHIQLSSSDRYCSYKITRHEITASPMNIVSLPSDNNGDVELLVETSMDLITWTPVYSGSAGTSNNAAFFRTRLIQN